MDESRALQRAGWAGAASVALLVVGLALTYLVGVDQASMSDAAILERLDDGGRQAAAGIGVPVLAAGVALLLWFATGLRQVLDRLSGGDPLAHAIVPAAALSASIRSWEALGSPVRRHRAGSADRRRGMSLSGCLRAPRVL